MKRKINGQLGDWKVNTAIARPIEINIKCACLELFKQGSGYRMAANALGLKLYTVRDWARRFKLGDESWAHRDGRKFHHCNEAAELIKYRDENETFISSSGSFASRNESCDSSKQSFGGRESQMVGSTEYAAAIPLYSAEGAYKRILSGNSRKKKEIDAVQFLIKQGWSIKDACRIAGIPRCTYYRALNSSEKAKSDAALVRLMCDIENDRHISSTYGVERLTGEVNNRLKKATPESASIILRNGTKVNHKRIHRLMKEHGIHSRIRRRKHPDNYYKKVKGILKKNKAPNILKRDFTSARPHEKMTTDVTYIPCSDQKFVYLSPLFDLFNHEIVSYSLSTVNSEKFVKSMLKTLPADILEESLIHNDQGSVYWSNGWVKLCDELKIIRSMSRRGNCWDNAMSENFFSTMKVDLGLTKRGYKNLLTAKEVKDLINDYIPWYNTERIQKNLGFMSPVQFREILFGKNLWRSHVDGSYATNGATISSNGAVGLRLGSSVRPFGDGDPTDHSDILLT